MTQYEVKRLLEILFDIKLELIKLTEAVKGNK